DQRIEQRRLAGIGVAHERDVEHIAAFALAALRGALLLDLDQPLARALDRLVDHAAIKLDLGFARSAARANAAALTLQVGPAAHQARGQVFQAGELRLELALMTARALAEDLENQQGAVGDAHVQMALEVALL